MTKGLVRTGFKEDLKIGQQAEGTLAIALGHAGTDIEVKSDLRATKTHNIYVETAYKGRPSGITTSGAHWWAYEINGRFFLLRVEDMRALVAKATEAGLTRRGGDFNMTDGVLIPVEWLVFLERK